MTKSRGYARPYDYLSRGCYDVFAERWFAAHGRTRVLFTLYEDLVTKPGPVLARIQAFIGVRPTPLGAEDLGVINSAKEMGPVFLIFSAIFSATSFMGRECGAELATAKSTIGADHIKLYGKD